MIDRSGGRRVPVWDVPVRVLHWTLAAAVAMCWTTGHWPPHHFDAWHHTAGYAAAAAVALRLAWGFAGRGHARLARFVRSPRAVLAYARALRSAREPRHLGHNPLGGWMIVALLLVVVGLAFTGWLYTTERFWGDETVEQVHVGLAWAILALVAMHVAGVVVAAFRHRENLVASMLDGKKRAPRGDDID